MKFLVSLLGLGTTVGGVFAGTLQQNLSNIKTEIDRLFEEIESDIRKFSEENPMTEKQKEEIKNPKTSSGEVQSKRKNRDTSHDEKAESKNTLEVWTDIWIQLLSNYIQTLWIGNSTTSSNENLESRNFSLEDKQKAIDAAEKNVEKEKKKFEEKLDSAKEEIQKIYKKMKKFLQIMKLPKKYNSSTHADTPYGEYVEKIKK